MKKIFVLTLICFGFISCSENLSKADLEGAWFSYYEHEKQKPFHDIRFFKDSVEILDDHLFKEKGVFEIERNTVKIELERGFSLDFKIDSFGRDSFFSSDSSLFYRDKNDLRGFGVKMDDFPLIGIETNDFLSDTFVLSAAICLYKNNKEEAVIRLGEKISPFEDIPLFLQFRSCAKGTIYSPQTRIFIGKGVKLSELINCYYHLLLFHNKKVILLLDKTGISDYHIFHDRVQIWEEQIEKFRNEMVIPPPPPRPANELNFKKNFLTQKPTQIQINSKADLNQLDNLQKGKKYLVSINSGLEIKDYIAVKTKIKELKKKEKIEVRTEIL